MSEDKVEVNIQCSFRGKDRKHKQLSFIIAGPGVHICNNCVRICVDIAFTDAEGKVIKEGDFNDKS